MPSRVPTRSSSPPARGPAAARPGSSTVDYGGAVKSVEAAIAKEIRRFLIVSAMGVNHPERWSDQMRSYYEAKAEADKLVMESGLDYTVVRPGGLTDDPGTGRVQIAEQLESGGTVTRDDVAAVLAACLTADNTVKKAFDLLSGDTPIEEAIAGL